MPISQFPNMDELLPHREDMQLIDKVISWDENGIQVATQLSDEMILVDDSRNIPWWAGIEFMAQAISAYAGMARYNQGLPILKGFLLGTRQYKNYTDEFKNSDLLVINASKVLIDDGGVSMFDCNIKIDNKIVAEATIKAIQPEDETLILQR